MTNLSSVRFLLWLRRARIFCDLIYFNGLWKPTELLQWGSVEARKLGNKTWVVVSQVNNRAVSNQLSPTVFDVWAKFQSGILHGNVRNFGLFTECVRFRQNTLPDVGLITGQHCTISFRSISDGSWNSDSDFSWRDMCGSTISVISNWAIINFRNAVSGKVAQANILRLQSGICLPASCSIDQVLSYSNRILEQADLQATDADWWTNEGMSLTVIDIIAMWVGNYLKRFKITTKTSSSSVFTLLFLLIISSTVYDVLMLSKTCKMTLNVL